MTQLNGTPLRRETASTRRYRRQLRPIVVELYAGYIDLRLKGTRARFSVPYDVVMEAAQKLKARADRAEKLAGKRR